MSGVWMGVLVWAVVMVVVYLLWLGSDLAKADEREHWDDE
ncbi:hypothetical protein GMA8713_01081 [Grimontia marina]|uniref:Uncharacterized protein n=1 Tax=Grimontia marina TaxID=646534 RepID=A0A128F091_9GAMM|nr:hypothetical protein GMA8713_01081 [Grimontia marina]